MEGVHCYSVVCSCNILLYYLFIYFSVLSVYLYCIQVSFFCKFNCKFNIAIYRYKIEVWLVLYKVRNMAVLIKSSIAMHVGDFWTLVYTIVAFIFVMHIVAIICCFIFSYFILPANLKNMTETVLSKLLFHLYTITEQYIIYFIRTVNLSWYPYRVCTWWCAVIQSYSALIFGHLDVLRLALST